jgi:hypothetical protein
MCQDGRQERSPKPRESKPPRTRARLRPNGSRAPREVRRGQQVLDANACRNLFRPLRTRICACPTWVRATVWRPSGVRPIKSRWRLLSLLSSPNLQLHVVNPDSTLREPASGLFLSFLCRYRTSLIWPSCPDHSLSFSRISSYPVGPAPFCQPACPFHFSLERRIWCTSPPSLCATTENLPPLRYLLAMSVLGS